MPRWTEDQEAAIVSRNANLLVSAAAGSGKTAVLVERIIRLIIDDQVPIQEMLVVTFTNAAASEMRERIIEALYKQLENNSSEFLRAQIGQIQNANIMTLHAFCIGVIRNNAHFINLDPGFKIGDTVELNLMQKEALDEILEEAYDIGDSSFYTFVESYSENRSDDKLQTLIMNTYRFIQSQPSPLQWLKSALDGLTFKDHLVELLKDHLSFDLKQGHSLLEEAILLSTSDGGPREYLEMLSSDMANVEELKTLLKDNLSDFVEKLSRVEHMRLKAISKSRKEEVDEKIAEEVKTLRQNYKDLIDDAKNFFKYKSLADYLDDIHEVEPMMLALYQLVEAFDIKYKSLKEEKNVVDFNDLEHLALEALTYDDVKKMYRDKFQYLFLDEYQDSNLVQETIMNQIKRSDNVFLVGDVKQSIYRFRLADPSLFMEKYLAYDKSKGAVNRRIDLKKNFRSREQILDGINFIFENLMSEEFGEMVYDEDAMLYPGIEFKPIENPEIKVNIIEGKYDGDDALMELSTAEVEAKSIVQEIKALIGTKSYDRKKDVYFDVAYRHIVILMRAVSAWTPVFNDVFMKENMPIFADVSGGYFDSLEIKMFVDLLRLIDNPLQDLPLLTVLRSPIFSFTTDDLMDIRIAYPKGHYHEAFVSYQDNTALRDKIRQVRDQLKQWQEASLYMPLDQLMWQIMTETGFYQYVGAMPGGKSRQGNLRLLLDRAEQASKTSFQGLFNFVKMVDKMKKTQSDFGTAKVIGETENVVRVMSIHKSKGLEFPIVFLAGMGKKFNLRDAYQDVLLHKEIGIGPKYVDPIHRVFFDTLPKKLIKRTIKFESLAEEMRVLYVALTRAVDKLILVGTIKGIENAASKWCRGHGIHNLVGAQSYLDWIMFILTGHPASKNIWNLAGKDYLGLKEHRTQWCINLQKRDDFYLTERESNPMSLMSMMTNLDAYRDVDVDSLIEKQFGFVYPHLIANQLPSKFSVTELKRLKSMDYEQLQYAFDPLNITPQFLNVEKKKSKAEVGTLIHFVMQHLDRTRWQEIDLQISELVKRGVLSHEDCELIDVKQLIGFFESPIGIAYRKAKVVENEKAFVLKRKVKTLIPDYTGDDDIMIQGIIDCYYEEEDGIVLVDYKTDYLLGDSEILVDRYKEQIYLYKEAIESITGQSVKASYIYSFFKNESILVK